MEFAFDVENIFEAHGIALSLIGMAIVFASLAIISLFIGCLPRALETLDRWTTRRPAAESPPHAPEAPPAGAVDDDILVAIAAVLDHELRRPDGSAPLRLTLQRSENATFWGRAGRMRSFSAQDLHPR